MELSTRLHAPPEEKLMWENSVWEEVNFSKEMNILLKWIESQLSKIDDKILGSRFKNDVKQILEDWLLTQVELDRVTNYKRTINLILNSKITDINEIADDDIENITSLKRLIHSRDILDDFWNDKWIWNLKVILTSIEWIWSSNIDENKLEEINELIESIFENWIDKTDIENLEKLQEVLLISYDLRQSKILDSYSLSKIDKKWEDKNEIISTTNLLWKIYNLDKKYWDVFNEKTPSLWLFLDSIAKEIKDWIIENDFNNIWAGLQTIFNSLNELMEKIDNPINLSFLEIQNIINIICLNSLNLARHSVPKIINLALTWIKEFKNYYLKSTWNENEHWVWIQKLHSKRKDVIESKFIPKSLATWIDNLTTFSLSQTNWASDALIDYVWFIINILVTPEKIAMKIVDSVADFVSEIQTNDYVKKIIDKLSDSKTYDLTPEILSKLNYTVAYLLVSIWLSTLTWTSLVWWLNSSVNKWLEFISSLTWKTNNFVFKTLKAFDKTSWRFNR